MFISPPILLRHNPKEHDDEWIERCMSGDAPGRGAYPLSHEQEWHGGLHLTAPRNGVKTEDIRAVSDGKVIFVRQPTNVSASDENHPLNYHDGYTSDACVVIEHCLEICPGSNGSFTFYSLYHHLADINEKLKAGEKVHRRDPVGHAGRIYGESDRFHFEICCDDANLAKLTGRASGELSTEKDGRVDIVFGEIYFLIPAGTPVFENEPVHWRADGHVQPPKSPGSKTWPDTEAQIPVCSTPSSFIIGSRCSRGFGSMPGDARCTSYRKDGVEFGSIIDTEDGAALYRTATKIVDDRTNPKTLEMQACPPTKDYHAVVEMLRFGRVIHPDDLTLTPADAPHWRKVKHEGGEGWINLNAPGVRKFSDADFPHWKGWLFVDDDSAPNDCKCESAKIQKILRGPADAGARAPDTALDGKTVQAQLKKTICKFPCEWEEANLEARWSWLKKTSAANPQPYSDKEYEAALAHLEALCFPCPELFGAQWRFEPREFIKLFRRCGWSAVSHRISKSVATGKLPDNDGLSTDLAADMYARMLLESADYLERSRKLRFEIDVRAALEKGEAIELGLRVPTALKENSGRGLNDDRMLVIKFNADDEFELVAQTFYTADPAGSYQDGPTRPSYWGIGRGGNNAPGQPNTPDANNDGHDDLGRLHEGIYVFAWDYSASKGPVVYTDQTGHAFNVLRPVLKMPSDRYFDGTWHFDEDRYYDANSPYADQRTMLQHKGYPNFTGSAGCQTFIESSTPNGLFLSFADFAKKLSLTNQHRFIYVLRTL